MREFYREIIEDKNKKPYLIIFSGESSDYIEGYLYALNKSGKNFSFDKLAGLCLLEKKNSDTYETLYTIEDAYQGKGLGSKIVDISKFMVKKLKARFVRLTKLERKIPHPMDRNYIYDANLSLYLKHGFSLCDPQQTKDMICDLYEESSISPKALALKRLKYRDQVYNNFT